MMKKLEGLQGGPIRAIGKVVSSTKFILTLGVLIIVGTFAAWQYHNTTNADRVFWGMVDNNLQTTSFARTEAQKNGSQSVEQTTVTVTSPEHRVFSRSVFTQTGVDEARAVTENIGTPTQDFVRYTDIKTADSGDFTDVLNVWGVEQQVAPNETNGRLYNQAVLGIFPIGNLSSSERRELMKTMKETNTYTYEIVQTERSLPFGRPTYVMQVGVDPVGYIKALKQFAKSIGLNHLDTVNPDDYAQAQQLSFVVSVDGWTHQIVATNQSGGSQSDTVNGRNLRIQLPGNPEETVPIEDLQTKLQSIE